MIRSKDEMVSEIRQKMRGGTGEVTITHVFKQEEFNGKCRLFAKVTIPVGASIGFHEHQNEEEVYYIVKGTAVVEDAGVQKEVGPGDAILTGGGNGHSIKNVGNQAVELVAVIFLYS